MMMMMMIAERRLSFDPLLLLSIDADRALLSILIDFHVRLSVCLFVCDDCSALLRKNPDNPEAMYIRGLTHYYNAKVRVAPAAPARSCVEASWHPLINSMPLAMCVGVLLLFIHLLARL